MSRAVLSVRAQALAYRIWGYASPLGWDVTAGQIAGALGVDPRRVGRIVAARGWGTRLRASASVRGSEAMVSYVDDFLEGA
ncbi:hypothetical protein [Puniceibacterium confluentis]|uniref:hypothetical protein n=1 Tax=Puniceibacterium confluentis TaxID=1958944 RepID=UPI00356704B7